MTRTLTTISLLLLLAACQPGWRPQAAQPVYVPVYVQQPFGTISIPPTPYEPFQNHVWQPVPVNRPCYNCQ